MRTKEQPTPRLITLIRMACKESGNASRLAMSIGETKGSVSGWIAGARPCPVEAQILMASLAAVDINATIKQAFIERHKGSQKGKLLSIALGKTIDQIDTEGF